MSTVCHHCHAPQADDAARCAACGQSLSAPEPFRFAPPIPLGTALAPPEAEFPLVPASQVSLPAPPGIFRRGWPAFVLFAVVLFVAPFLRPVPRKLPPAEAQIRAEATPGTLILNGPIAEPSSEAARVEPPLRADAAAPRVSEAARQTPAASLQTLTVPRQPGLYRIAGRLVTVQSASQPERAEQAAVHSVRRARRRISTPAHSRLTARAPRPAPVVKVAASLEDAAAPRFYRVVACRFPRSYNAAVLTEALRQRGFAAVMRREPGGTRFAVETGTFRRLDTARQALRSLRDSGYQAALVAEK